MGTKQTEISVIAAETLMEQVAAGSERILKRVEGIAEQAGRFEEEACELFDIWKAIAQHIAENQPPGTYPGE